MQQTIECSPSTPAATGPGDTHPALRRSRSSEARLQDQELVMTENAVRSIRVKRDPMEVSSVSGEFWVTIAGDHEDHVLGPGESVLLHGCAHAVMLALSAGRVRITFRGRPASRAAALTRAAWRRLTGAAWARRVPAP